MDPPCIRSARRSPFAAAALIATSACAGPAPREDARVESSAIHTGSASGDKASAIFYRDAGDGTANQKCSASGVIVDGKRYVLTAAHCLAEARPADDRVVYLDRYAELLDREALAPYFVVFPNGATDVRIKLTKAFASTPPAGIQEGERNRWENMMRFGDFALLALEEPKERLADGLFLPLGKAALAAGATATAYGCRSPGASNDMLAIWEQPVRITERALAYVFTSTAVTHVGDSGGRLGSAIETRGVSSTFASDPFTGKPSCTGFSVVTEASARAVLAGTWSGYEPTRSDGSDYAPRCIFGDGVGRLETPGPPRSPFPAHDADGGSPLPASTDAPSP